MYPVEWFAGHEALQGFDAKGELPLGQGPLGPEAPLAEPFQVGGRQVLGPVDDPEVLRSPALDAGLDEAAPPDHDRLGGLDHHAFAPGDDSHPSISSAARSYFSAPLSRLIRTSRGSNCAGDCSIHARP